MGESKRANERRVARRSAERSAAEPASPAYTPPDKEDCEEQVFPVDMGVGERLTIVLWFHDGRMVHFCIEIQVRDDSGGWCPVVRVDTSHGTVHRHEMRAGRDDVRSEILSLPGDDQHRAWGILDSEYEKAYADLTSECDAYVQRWRTS